MLSSSQLASLHSTLLAGEAGQTAVEPPLAGVGSAPSAHVGSVPSAHVKPSLPSVGVLASSHTAEAAAGAVTVTLVGCEPLLLLGACATRWRTCLACVRRRRWAQARAADAELAERDAQRAATARAELVAGRTSRQASAASSRAVSSDAARRAAGRRDAQLPGAVEAPVGVVCDRS